MRARSAFAWPGRSECNTGRAETIAALTVIALWCATLMAPATSAADDVRVLATFQTDEALQVNLVGRALEDGRFAFTYGTYPHLFFNTALVPLKVIAVARPVTERDIAVALRSVCLGFAAATILLIFLWARQVYGRAAAWLSMGILMVNPMYYAWAVYAHPDVVQLFFLMFALYLLVQFVNRPSTARLLATSVVAGLAFATKYGGLPLLPLIWAAIVYTVHANRRPMPTIGAWPMRMATALIAVALIVGAMWLEAGWLAAHVTEDGQLDLPAPERTIGFLRHLTQSVGVGIGALALFTRPWTALQRSDRLRRVVQEIVSSVVAFVAAFTIVSPYSWARLAFIKGLVYHTVHGGLVEPVTSANWAAFITAEMGAWTVATAALTAVWVIVSLKRPGVTTVSDVVLVTWTALFFVVLFLPVHGVARHYVLPLIPPMILLACRGLTGVAAVVGQKLPSSAARRVAAAVAVAALIVLEAPLAVRLAAERKATLARVETSDAVWVGRWLQCHAPRSARIAYDYSSYVPMYFSDVRATWGGTLAWLGDVDPDAVIVNGFVSDHYATDDPERAAYYAALANGRGGFDPLLTRGTFAVYARRSRLPGLFQAGPTLAGCLPESAEQ